MNLTWPFDGALMSRCDVRWIHTLLQQVSQHKAAAHGAPSSNSKPTPRWLPPRRQAHLDGRAREPQLVRRPQLVSKE
jgi:hypothetical protein